MPTYPTLSDILKGDGAKAQVVGECKALVEQELAGKSGLSAAMLKGAYKVVTALAPGYYDGMVGRLVPEFLGRLQPYWTEFHNSGSGTFGDYLAGRGAEVSEALLGVTDALAGRSGRAVIKRAYASVRGGAADHIQAALPSVGALVEKYAA